jgi:hypothetical protein
MKRIHTWPLALVAVAVPTAAQAVEQTPSISGNGWVALGVIAVLVAIVALVIRGTLSVSDRGETANDDGGGLPFFGDEDDDEKPRKKR